MRSPTPLGHAAEHPSALHTLVLPIGPHGTRWITIQYGPVGRSTTVMAGIGGPADPRGQELDLAQDRTQFVQCSLEVSGVGAKVEDS